VKRAMRETQRDRLTRLQADRLEQEIATNNRELIPAGEIEPTWKHRVMSAAAFLAGQHSRLAGILEATPGVEAKRTVLRTEFGAFLTRLGVDGERMQDEIERLLGQIADTEAADFLKRLTGQGADPAAPMTRIPNHDPTPDVAPSGEPGVGGVRPAAEGPALGVG